MADKTGIEWTDATWNPVTGCTEVSPGCDHCYAKTFAERWRGTPGHYFDRGFDVQLRPDKLDLPLRWKKPRRIFVNSMSDLFHDQVPDDYIAAVFGVMATAIWHTFQVLTKRHARMRSLLSSDQFRTRVEDYADEFATDDPRTQHESWPLDNVWLGVSAENQQWADIRIPALLDTPAAVRFISAEPLLGPIDLRSSLRKLIPALDHPRWDNADKMLARDMLHWVIVGGESGHGARPMHPDWARQLRDQCESARIPFLFKQHGEWVPESMVLHRDNAPAAFMSTDGRVRPLVNGKPCEAPMSRGDDITIRRVGKHRAGRQLDRRTWDQYPQGATA